jgi:hypothetical protein
VLRLLLEWKLDVLVDERPENPGARGLDLVPHAGLEVTGTAIAKVVDELLVLLAHLGPEVAEIEAEEEEALHRAQKLVQHPEESLVATK